MDSPATQQVPEAAMWLFKIEQGTARLHSWDELQQMMREARNAARKV